MRWRRLAVETLHADFLKGESVGAVPLTSGPLSYIIRNRHYLGEINHNGRAYPGEHAAIIDAAFFDAVQLNPPENLNRKASNKARRGALLMGKIFDDRDDPMSSSHAVKKGVRYRYYVSAPLAQGRRGEAVLGSRLKRSRPQSQRRCMDLWPSETPRTR